MIRERITKLSCECTLLNEQNDHACAECDSVTRQETVLLFLRCLRILAIGMAAFAVAAVIYHVLRNWFFGTEDKLTKKQMRRQARKAAKASRKAGRPHGKSSMGGVEQ